MGSEWWDGNRRRVAKDVVTGILAQVNTRRHGCKAGKIARIFGCQRWCVQLSLQPWLLEANSVWGGLAVMQGGSVKHWNPTIIGLIHTGKIQFVAQILKLEFANLSNRFVLPLYFIARAKWVIMVTMTASVYALGTWKVNVGGNYTEAFVVTMDNERTTTRFAVSTTALRRGSPNPDRTGRRIRAEATCAKI